LGDGAKCLQKFWRSQCFGLLEARMEEIYCAAYKLDAEKKLMQTFFPEQIFPLNNLPLDK